MLEGLGLRSDKASPPFSQQSGPHPRYSILPRKKPHILWDTCHTRGAGVFKISMSRYVVFAKLFLGGLPCKLGVEGVSCTGAWGNLLNPRFGDVDRGPDEPAELTSPSAEPRCKTQK